MESRGEVGIALVGNDREDIDIVNGLAEQFLVLTHAVAVYTDTQTAPHFLTLGGAGVAVAQSTDLKHIRVVPTLTQCGV